MNTHTQAFVGIDVASRALDIHVHPLGAEHHIDLGENQDARPLLKILETIPAPIERIVIEATGGYEQPIARLLAEHQWPIVIVQPRRVREFARAKGLYAKTDRLDARLLAEYAQQIAPEQRPIPSENQAHFSAIVRRRAQLVAQRAKEKNHLKSPGIAGTIADSIKRVIAMLGEEIKLLEKQIGAYIKENPQREKRHRQLQTMPSVGAIAATVLLANLPELGTLTHREAAALAGLAPMCHDSGERRGRRPIYGGRKTVRSILYQCAVSAQRYNPEIRAHFLQMRERGKPAKVAMTACARKILIQLNAMLRTGNDYQSSTKPLT